MHYSKLMAWAISTSVVSSGLVVFPGSAQQIPNQSDITGTNIWNNTAPIFDRDRQLAPEILDNARRLSRELEQASSVCCTAAAPTTVRRFSRNPDNSDRACQECDRLDRLVRESRVFLDDVNRQVQQVRDNRDRLW